MIYSAAAAVVFSACNYRSVDSEGLIYSAAAAVVFSACNYISVDSEGLVYSAASALVFSSYNYSSVDSEGFPSHAVGSARATPIPAVNAFLLHTFEAFLSRLTRQRPLKYHHNKNGKENNFYPLEFCAFVMQIYKETLIYEAVRAYLYLRKMRLLIFFYNDGVIEYSVFMRQLVIYKILHFIAMLLLPTI